MGFTDPQWRLFIVHASCKFHRRWVESISLRRICRGKYMYIYSRFQRKILCSNDCRSHRQAQETEGWTILRATCIRRRKEQPLTTLLLLDFVRCPKPRFGPSAYHTVYARTYACLCFFAPHHNGYSIVQSHGDIYANISTADHYDDLLPRAGRYPMPHLAFSGSARGLLAAGFNRREKGGGAASPIFVVRYA